ncbi:NAD(P)/FAD-dependent oxidoreductase [Nocardioides jiangxiensis]|uniref:FAD-dependent oxidoreductase n=1 Tax=Nocardioides jiangxiensis TaxID=3064524 RepID=A0ABT9B155_9ACTN|nr:FAD-dependent oxidoreductase [Nocardioides sp. WY-20]MDO7868569.1 FAD-dependent oxidoreductase [Nocardioides sp. WY-20]
MDEPRSIVIVGGGLAAAHAVESLRDMDYAGRLTVVAREPHLPYERPPLSKGYLAGNDEREAAFPHDAGWYRDNDVTVRVGTAATDLDLGGRVVVLDSGESLGYDRLLIATGASPRTLQLPGIGHALTLRTIDDSERLRAAFAKGGRLVVIGAGWIGLEVAATARQAGMEVTVLEAGERPLGAVFGPVLADHLTAIHQRNGVVIHTGVTIEAVTEHGVVTSDDTFEADLVLLGVGATPTSGLAESAGLAVDDGILTDEHLRTSDPYVHAAGDVANARNTVLGRHLRVEHWDNAIRQGRLAGRTMLGVDDTYDWLPYFFTDQFDFSMEYVGRSAPDDEVVLRGDVDAGEFVAWWLRDGVVTAGMNVNVWDVNDRIRELVGQRVDPADLPDLQ